MPGRLPCRRRKGRHERETAMPEEKMRIKFSDDVDVIPESIINNQVINIQ
jgi:hypothetical protein